MSRSQPCGFQGSLDKSPCASVSPSVKWEQRPPEVPPQGHAAPNPTGYSRGRGSPKCQELSREGEPDRRHSKAGRECAGVGTSSLSDSVSGYPKTRPGVPWQAPRRALGEDLRAGEWGGGSLGRS